MIKMFSEAEIYFYRKQQQDVILHLQKWNDIRKMLERRFNANDLTLYELEVAKKIDADLKSALDE